MNIPIDNLTITKDTILSPGEHILHDGLRIEGSNITLEGNGTVLYSSKDVQSCIYVENAENITIKNITIQGFYHGIVARNVTNLMISNCTITGTHELKANTIFLDIWIPVDNAYGGGILLHKVEDSQVVGNSLSHQMNGLLTYQCNHLQVKNNLANYCSSWGFHLNQTSDSLFENNFAEFCCRYEPRGEDKGHLGADACGFLIVNRSCRNVFRHNLARMGGDGFFLAGMSPEYKYVGCDNNIFEYNDGSYSPNNAFEATFSQGNVFRSNSANYSNYGFWLGFSKGGTMEGNQVIGNRQAGIAVENGIDFMVRRNTFLNNRHGILLWSKQIPQFVSGVPENTTSLNWQIEENKFIGNHKAIRIAADQDHGIRALPKTGELGLPAPKPNNHRIINNRFEENIYVINQTDTLNTLIGPNELKNNYHE